MGSRLHLVLHIFVLLQDLQDRRDSIGSILGILGIYGVFLMIFHKGLPKLGKLKIPVLLYAAVLSSMVSMAVSAAVIVPGRSRYFLAAGACAFSYIR